MPSCPTRPQESIPPREVIRLMVDLLFMTDRDSLTTPGMVTMLYDPAFLFLQHMPVKMKPEGSRIGIVFNGSPLFTG